MQSQRFFKLIRLIRFRLFVEAVCDVRGPWDLVCYAHKGNSGCPSRDRRYSEVSWFGFSNQLKLEHEQSTLKLSVFEGV